MTERSRERQRLCDLVSEQALALPLYIYGPSGCGKSAVVRSVLDEVGVPTAYVDCLAQSTAQTLFESALNQLAGHRPSSTNGYSNWAICDSVGAFIAGLRQLVSVLGRVCLVFDKAERLSARGELLQTLVELPELVNAAAAITATADEDGRLAGGVLPIFVGETLWANFQRVCEGDPCVVPFRFQVRAARRGAGRWGDGWLCAGRQ